MRSQAALAHALIGVKVINLLIAKHEYLRSSVATCARPIGFMLDPANQCHLGCPSCVNSYNTKVVESNYNKWPRGLMSRETFGTFLREVGLYAFSGAFYNNHEPLLNRHTPEFLGLTSDLHVRTFISSNLSFRRIDAEEIVASGLTELMVAADGVSQDVYERYRRGGKIEWVLENARAIAEAKRRLKSRTPIMRWQYLTFEHNVHEIERALQLAREIGFDSFNLATPNEVSFDDPSIECVNYSGQKSFELRPREFLAFSRDLEPHRAMIEKALEESAADRRLRETGGHDGANDKTGIRCDWLHMAIISDAMGRVVPCCNADYKNHGRFVLANLATSNGNVMNSADYRAARQVLSDPQGGKTDVICARCPNRSKPQVGLGGVGGYIDQVPALALTNMAFLYDWSRHSPL